MMILNIVHIMTSHVEMHVAPLHQLHLPIQFGASRNFTVPNPGTKTSPLTVGIQYSLPFFIEAWIAVRYMIYSWWFRNPAIARWYVVYLPLFTRFYLSQVVGLGISEPSTEVFGDVQRFSQSQGLEFRVPGRYYYRNPQKINRNLRKPTWKRRNI